MLAANVVGSVPSKMRNLRKMRIFWANFTDSKSGINIIKCKMHNCCLYLGKANVMQKFCKRGPQSIEIFGQKF